MNRILPLLMILVGVVTAACSKSEDAASKPQTVPAAPSVAGPAQPVPTVPAPVVATTTVQPLPTSYPATTQPGRILVGDLLAVEVSDLTGPGSALVVPKEVAADGTISMPYMSKPLAVAGMTDGQAQQAVTEQYRVENIIQRAPVNVRRLRVAGTGGAPPGPIAPYDLVRISISDLAGPAYVTALVARADGDGMVNLPYIGPRKIAGLTDQQAEAAIAKTYRSENIVQHAWVSVLRLEAAPPDAGRVDLPDVPIYPIPEILRWLYEPQETRPSK
jgi:protein involved in polysaccharide export with SLBB domain